MSTLDRALAKLYRVGPAEPPVALRPADDRAAVDLAEPSVDMPTGALQPTVADALTSIESTVMAATPDVEVTVESEAPPRESGISVTELYGPKIAFPDLAHAGVRRPHADFRPHLTKSPYIELPPLATQQANRPGQATSDTPHASEAADEGTLPIVRVHQPLRPVFEVPRFNWPQLTKTLVELAASEFTALAKQLAVSSRQGQKLVLVTGCCRTEGRTTVGLTLARALAAQGTKAALVDADFEHPRLADRLGVLPQVGWEDVLWGEQPLAEALIESLDDHLTILPLKQAVSLARGRLPGDRIKTTWQSLAQRYDIVVLDGGPLAETRGEADATCIARFHRLDTAIVVRDVRRTSVEQSTAVGKRLTCLGVGQWCIAENFQAA